MGPLPAVLLSHHTNEEHYRCLLVPTGGRPLRLCARCTGITLGAVVSAAWLLFVGELPTWLALLGCVDWLLYRFGLWKGLNAVRLASGMLLGLFYVDSVTSPFRGTVDAQLLVVAGALAVVFFAGWVQGIGYDPSGRLEHRSWFRLGRRRGRDRERTEEA